MWNFLVDEMVLSSEDLYLANAFMKPTILVDIERSSRLKPNDKQ